MSDQVQLAGLVGSLREESYTRVAIARALSGAKAVGAGTELVDLRTYHLPVFDPDDRDAGDAESLQRTVGDADAILLGTPMYHGSYASPLKNALDYCGFDEFENTTVGLLAVAGGNFPLTALDHLRSVCRSLDAWVLPYQAAVPTARDVIEDGRFTDAELEDRVAALGRRAVRFANIEPDPTTFESEQNVGAED